MDSWRLIGSTGDYLTDLVIMALLLIAGALLKSRIRLFQRFLLPSSLIAGFLGLILGPDLLALIPISQARLGFYVYHLLALTFIGVGLQTRSSGRSYGVVNLGFMQVSVMLMQAIIGIIVALVIALTVLPQFTPATGLLLPLGFAMGPGIAFSIGTSWRAFGFHEAANVGLSIAAIGFLVAYISGVWIMSRLGITRTTETSGGSAPFPGQRSWWLSLSVQLKKNKFWRRFPAFGVHFLIVVFVYAGTFVMVSILANLLSAVGLESDVPILWSFHFIFANIFALTLRNILDIFFPGRFFDDSTMHKATRATADILILTSIAGISLQVGSNFIGPVLLMCLFGTIGTYYLLSWTSSHIFKQYRSERFVGLYAQMTGTISSGLALVQATDPDYRTPVAQDLVLSSGMALSIGFPLLLVINLPFTVFHESLSGYVIILAILIVYLAGISGVWYRYVLKNRS